MWIATPVVQTAMRAAAATFHHIASQLRAQREDR
jgi:hypothetical protein